MKRFPLSRLPVAFEESPPWREGGDPLMKAQRVLNVNSNDNETLIAHEFTQINTNLKR